VLRLALTLFFPLLLLAQDPQQALAQQVSAMNSRLNSGTPGSQQIISDAQALQTGYMGLGPMAGMGGFMMNRDLAQGTYSWLSRASSITSDPAARAAVLSAYGTVGDFYNRGNLNRPGAAWAYGGANRLARGLVLGGGGGRNYERDLERYGLAWAAASYMGGQLFGPAFQTQPPQEGDQYPPPAPPTELQPVALPPIDEATLTPEQKAAWPDLRNKFIATAAKVHEARVVLEQLTRRLESQRMSLNTSDAARALMMQGFLDDAVDLIKAKKFDEASEALTRSDYCRTKLKDVTGQ